MRGPAILFVFAALFLVELLAWFAFGLLGFAIGGQWGQGWAWALGILAFSAVATLWGLLASPRSHAPRWAQWTTKLVVLGGASAILGWSTPAAGIAFAICAAVLVGIAELPFAREIRAITTAPRERR